MTAPPWRSSVESKIVEFAKRILDGQVPTVDDGVELARAVIAMADDDERLGKLADEWLAWSGKVPPGGAMMAADEMARSIRSRLRRSAEGGK